MTISRNKAGGTDHAQVRKAVAHTGRLRHQSNLIVWFGQASRVAFQEYGV